jgi:hypothetical protein
MLFVNSSISLASTAGTFDILQRWYESSSNASYVDLMWVRTSTGNNWDTASQRFQAKTDSTWQGFIEFNGTNNNYGVTIGAGSSTSSPTSVPGILYITGGNIGIGIANPTYTLHVVGAIYATGDITALSDQRYKQNITLLNNSLNNISHISGYSYTRTDYKPGEKQIGLLAQEVKEIYPEAVSYDTQNDIYSINYGCLIAPMIESIKELKEQLNELKEQMKELLGRP